MTLLGAHVALCQANKNFTNSKPIFCKCGFLTNRRNFLSLVETQRFFNKKNRITYRKVLDKNRLDLMASRLRIRYFNPGRGIETRSNQSRCLVSETRLDKRDTLAKREPQNESDQ